MSRRAPPLSSFAPELLEVWRKASTEIVSIKMPSREAATKLRHRLYSLRKSMEQASHELYSSAAHATITITQDSPGDFVVNIQPVDSNLKDALAEAGIGIPPAPEIEF